MNNHEREREREKERESEGEKEREGAHTYLQVLMQNAFPRGFQPLLARRTITFFEAEKLWCSNSEPFRGALVLGALAHS